MQSSCGGARSHTAPTSGAVCITPQSETTLTLRRCICIENKAERTTQILNPERRLSTLGLPKVQLQLYSVVAQQVAYI